jgi:hypothetical protein
MSTFTVYSINDTSTAQSGLSLEQAVDLMLSDDGRDWEIRRYEGRHGSGWQIWNTYQNHARPWKSTMFISAAGDEATARAELLAEVGSPGNEVNHMRIETDEAFAKMEADFAAEEAAYPAVNFGD